MENDVAASAGSVSTAYGIVLDRKGDFPAVKAWFKGAARVRTALVGESWALVAVSFFDAKTQSCRGAQRKQEVRLEFRCGAIPSLSPRSHGDTEKKTRREGCSRLESEFESA